MRLEQEEGQAAPPDVECSVWQEAIKGGATGCPAGGAERRFDWCGSRGLVASWHSVAQAQCGGGSRILPDLL